MSNTHRNKFHELTRVPTHDTYDPNAPRWKPKHERDPEFTDEGRPPESNIHHSHNTQGHHVPQAKAVELETQPTYTFCKESMKRIDQLKPLIENTDDTTEKTRYEHEILDLCECINGFCVKNQQFRTYMNTEINEVWKAEYGLDPHFQACFRDRSMLTAVPNAKLRNEHAQGFCANNLKTVFDVFAGKGGDLFTWAMVDTVEKIYANTTILDKYVYHMNEAHFKKAMAKQHKKVPRIFVNTKSETGELYSSIDLTFDNICPDLDVLYLDPPWCISENFDDMYKPITLYDDPDERIKHESTDVQILKMLNDQVITKLMDKGVHPQLIIIKGRWDFDRMTELIHMIPGYKIVEGDQFKPFFNFYRMFFLERNGTRRNDCDNGQKFEDIIRKDKARKCPHKHATAHPNGQWHENENELHTTRVHKPKNKYNRTTPQNWRTRV